MPPAAKIWRCIPVVLTLISQIGCYQPIDPADYCHPLDPECADHDYDRDGFKNSEDNCPRISNPDQDDPDLDGLGSPCDPCPARVCGGDCGQCADPGRTCDQEGQCVCQNQECSDGYCTSAGECCQEADCGTGAWECSDQHSCECQKGSCEDGHCPGAGECCLDEQDDGQCPTDQFCQERVCHAGTDGELIIDGLSCRLADKPCPPEVLQPNGTTWLLVSNDLELTNVTIRGGAKLTAPAINSSGQGGELVINATGLFLVESDSQVSMIGRGYGGGGGGGGMQYCDADALCKFGSGGGTGFTDPSGQTGMDGDMLNCYPNGYTPSTVGSGNGGAGGGYGGQPGKNGGGCPLSCDDPPYPMENGSGGAGGGPFGGAGGSQHGLGNTCAQNQYCDDREGPGGAPQLGEAVQAESGERGGYAASGGNGDTSTNELVLIGSGGGGGAGGAGASGWCCGAAEGGHGGGWGGLGRAGCTGGGGGGGGAAGGGAIVIRSRDIEIQGGLYADGAGRADLLGGYGAGGGILLYARQSLSLTGAARSLGGLGDQVGTPLNGGTIKLFYRYFSGSVPAASQAGRVLTRDMSE